MNKAYCICTKLKKYINAIWSSLTSIPAFRHIHTQEHKHVCVCSINIKTKLERIFLVWWIHFFFWTKIIPYDNYFTTLHFSTWEKFYIKYDLLKMAPNIQTNVWIQWRYPMLRISNLDILDSGFISEFLNKNKWFCVLVDMTGNYNYLNILGENSNNYEIEPQNSVLIEYIIQCLRLQVIYTIFPKENIVRKFSFDKIMQENEK